MIIRTSAYVVDSNIGGIDLYATLVKNRVLWNFEYVDSGTWEDANFSDYTSIISSNIYIERKCKNQEFIFIAPYSETDTRANHPWNMHSRYLSKTPYLAVPQLNKEHWITIRSDATPDIAKDILAFLSMSRENTSWCYGNKLGDTTYRVITPESAELVLKKFQPDGIYFNIVKQRLSAICSADFVTAHDMTDVVVDTIWECITNEKIFTHPFRSAFFRRWITMPRIISHVI